MGSSFVRQEQYNIHKKLVLENIRRVFFACLACVAIVPVMLWLKKSPTSEFAQIEHGVLVCFEIFSGIGLIVSYTAFRTKDIRLSKMIVRSFWLLFELFSFVIIYADKTGGADFSFYSIMATALFIVPAISVSEQIYYLVLLAVYSVFMAIKFDISNIEIFNMSVSVAMLFTMSRLSYASLEQRFKLMEHEREVRDGESIDTLTGLLNRKGLEKRAYASIPACISSKRRISLLMIDIDEMGKYNDAFGPDYGDECIKEVSKLVKQIVLRNTDMICRLSGGRFLVYMEGGNDMEPVTLGEKVRTNVERKRIAHGRRASNMFVTVTVGVASCIPRSEADFSELYDEAEDSLFEGKERGKNVTVYEEQIYGQYNRKASY